MIDRHGSRKGIVDVFTAITFDLWQTLILDDRDLGSKRAQQRIEGVDGALRLCGLEFSLEHLWQAYRDCAVTCNAVRAQGRDISFNEQISSFIECIDESLCKDLPDETITKIGRVYDQAFWCFPPPVHPEAATTLNRLKNVGYKLALISNTGMTPGATFRQYMKQMGLLSYFDVLIFSDEALVAKPNRKIFQLAIDALGTTANMVVHVGDDRTNDAIGAKLAGFKTIWISDKIERQEDNVLGSLDLKPDITVTDLAYVVEAVLTLAKE